MLQIALCPFEVLPACIKLGQNYGTSKRACACMSVSRLA